MGRFYILAGELARRRYPGVGTDDFVRFSDFQPIKRYSSLAVDMRPRSNIILVGAHPAAGTTDYVLMMTTEGDREPFYSRGVPTNRPTWTVAINRGADGVSILGLLKRVSPLTPTAKAIGSMQSAYSITYSKEM